MNHSHWRLNYEAAKRECAAKGTKLGRWPGDPEEVGNAERDVGIDNSNIHGDVHHRGDNGDAMGRGNTAYHGSNSVQHHPPRDLDVSGVVMRNEQLGMALEEISNLRQRLAEAERFLMRDRFPSKMVLEALAVLRGS